MSIRITVETASKAEAQLIADQLPGNPQAESWRGFGVIRLAAKSREETRKLIATVSESFREYELQWARVRYGDEEHVFKKNGRRAG